MEEFGVVLFLLPHGNHALAFSSLFIDPLSSVQVFPRQGTGWLHGVCISSSPNHSKALVPAPVWLLWEDAGVPTLKAESSERTGKLLCVPGKGLPSSRVGEQAPCWWHSPWKWRSMVTKNTRSLEPSFNAGAQPGLCHCWITMWQHNKPSVTAVNQPEFRLLGSTWWEAPWGGGCVLQFLVGGSS